VMQMLTEVRVGPRCCGKVLLRSLYSDAKQQSKKQPTLRDFLVGAWEQVLHPSETFKIDGAIYLDLICEWLTLVSVGTAIATGRTAIAGQMLSPYNLTVDTLDNRLVAVRRLLINVSPRCAKSTVVTVCWPCWEWLYMPWMTYMTMSYDQTLASDHSDDRRTLVQSDWYQQLSGGMTLSNSKNRLTEFRNGEMGQMVARGLQSGVTGGGGLRLIFDDPNDPNKVESDAIREKARKAFRGYSTTRQNDPKLSAVVVVQQRTHEQDVSGYIVAHEPEYETVIVPMEAEKDEEICLPLSRKKWRRSPGEFMHPDRFDSETIGAIKRDQKTWAGHYQQRPAPAGGGFIKLRDWRLYAKVPRCDRWILSIDATRKGGTNSDFVTIGVIGQIRSIRKVKGLPSVSATGNLQETWVEEHRYVLRDRWRGQAGITETENQIRQMAERYPEAAEKLIEDAANGTPILERLGRTMRGLVPYKTGSQSKVNRAAAAQPVQGRGDVMLPLDDWAIAAVKDLGLTSITLGEWWDLHPPPHQTDAEHAPVPSWVKSFLDENALFPSGRYDDQVDMWVQAINWMEARTASAGLTLIQPSSKPISPGRQSTQHPRFR
ncbi:MAG: hypothetical protein HC771_23985, partial [Synechococcales cyanobacterium CRU_2_2]|nr:hypothetical protein [Synechococcales cyanobacterium CRU_2_2]